jgi:hypothetical protein
LGNSFKKENENTQVNEYSDVDGKYDLNSNFSEKSIQSLEMVTTLGSSEKWD